MSGPPESLPRAGPSPQQDDGTHAHATAERALQRQGLRPATGRERDEKAIVEDALRRLPQLDPFPGTPLVRRTSGTGGDSGANTNSPPTPPSMSRAGSSYALAADDEALLLQELLNITAGAAPFVASVVQEPGGADSSGAAHRPATSSPKSPATTASAPTASQSPAEVLSKNKRASTSSTKRKIAHTATPTSTAAALKEEQDILDAILAAVDGQQSSVSGNLVGGAHDAGNEDARAEDDEDVDEVELVLEQAKMLATSTVLCETQRGELVVHIHEHVALRHRLADLSKAVGAATCVAMADRGSAGRYGAAALAVKPLYCCIGTTLGAVVLLDSSWTVLGMCGSVEAGVVNSRGAVVALSVCTAPASSSGSDGAPAAEEPTAASGHARGVFVLWSLRSLAALRVVSDECHVPLLRVANLHRDPLSVVVLESSGAVKLFQFWTVLSRHMLRSSTLVSPSSATPVSDVDTLPLPSAFYLAHLATVREHLPALSSAASADAESGAPWLCAPPLLPTAAAASAGVPRAAWSTSPGKHLVAAVTNDALLVYVVDAKQQGGSAAVARHTHPPSSALSNELVRFIALENETSTPRVLLCVSWNTEVELLLVNWHSPQRQASASAGTTPDPVVTGVERLALLRTSAPLVQMMPLAGCNVLLCDQNNDAQLMDASVAVMVERHHFAALEYVGFAHRLCGTKYHGTSTSNRAAAFLLGKGTAYGISLRSWRERLSSLLARRRFTEALDLAKGFAEEVALSMVGLSSNAAQRRRELHVFMERILLAYIEHRLGAPSTSVSTSGKAVAGAGPASTAEEESLYEVLQRIASYCNAVDGLDLLYGSVARALQKVGRLPHLLYVLEQCMRHGVVTYMPEPLVERFIALFLSPTDLAAVEAALGIARPQSPAARSDSAASTSTGAVVATGVLDPALALPGKERAELALMCLETGIANLLRLSQAHGLLRLTVTVLSLRQHRYVEALAYALDTEEAAENEGSAAGSESVRRGAVQHSPARLHTPRDAPSVAVEFVQCTLKDCSLLSSTDLPASELRPAKRAVLEYLLQTSTGAARQPNLLRFLRRQPEHAMRVLLFALSDEGPYAPWGGTDGLSRTQFVSSVYFLLTGGTTGQPRNTTESDMIGPSGQRLGALDLFRVDDEVLARLPALRTLKAAELAQRAFPPYLAVHTFVAGAALFNELFLAPDAEAAAVGGVAGGPAVRLDVWTDLVIQDVLFAFQHADTAAERCRLQEHLQRVLTTDFVPIDRVALYLADFTRLRMARCLAALLCKEGCYAEAIACYLDPVQNRVDAQLQHDVFEMLRGEMQRLQDLKTQATNRAQLELTRSHRFHSISFDDGGDESGGAVSADRDTASAIGSDGQRKASSVFQADASAKAGAGASMPATAAGIEVAIKALQRAVMGQVEVLVRIDATALAQFIFDYLPSNYREVMRLLRGSSAAFLDYLDELMAQGDPAVAGDMNLQNTYIELLCAHAPRRVCGHLEQQGNQITYDVQLALRAVRKHRIADAAVYLLEKTMQVDEAMTVMLRAVRDALAALREEVLTALTQAAGEGKNAAAPETSSTPPEPRRRSSGQAGNVAMPAATPPPVDLSALASALELRRYVAIGEELCGKYHPDRVASGSPGGAGLGGGAAAASGSTARPEFWFRLLDVFMVPRRLLCETLMHDDRLRADAAAAAPASPSRSARPGGGAGLTGVSSELELATRLATTTPRSSAIAANRSAVVGGSGVPLPLAAPAAHLPPPAAPLLPEQRRCVEALVAVYTEFTSGVLRAMMRSLDLAVVVDKVVQDNKDEAFRAFKPVILDIMASLSFELEASRLCELATESDVMLLGRELYQHLNTGVVPQSDCCAVCHVHLSEPPQPSAAEAAAGERGAADSRQRGHRPGASAVCVYPCGHAFHTVCSAAVMGTERAGCWVCLQQRFSSCSAAARRGSGGQGWPSSLEDAASAASAPRAAPAPAESAVDVARMQRRVRQTKVKVDHAEDLYPMLKLFLVWDSSLPESPAQTEAAAAAAGAAACPGARPPLERHLPRGKTTAREEGVNWVLAPSPRVPVTIGEVSEAAQATSTPAAAAAPAATPHEKLLSVETLTDAEILELFGSF